MNCRKFPKFPYRGGKFSKVGNYCGNLSLPSGNLLVCDLVTLAARRKKSSTENNNTKLQIKIQITEITEKARELSHQVIVVAV